jgi:hypothetical protein
MSIESWIYKYADEQDDDNDLKHKMKPFVVSATAETER